MKFIKKYIDGGKLGSIYNIALETGYYLPYWRPNQDYTKGYAAKKSSGGGIILDGGIHNFDLMFWLNDFTGVERTEIVHNKASDLKIETEDNFLSILKFKNKVLGLVKGDYLQQSYSWTCKVVGSKGNLRWDFVSNTVYIDTKKGSRKLLQKTKYDANEMYVEQLRYFLSCINQRKQTFNSVKISAEVLKHCLKR